MPRTLKPEKLDILRTAYKRGWSVAQAARCAGVTVNTTCRKFHLFKAAGLERATPWPHVKRSVAQVRPKYPQWHLPAYTGPEWIGKAIDTESRI